MQWLFFSKKNEMTSSLVRLRSNFNERYERENLSKIDRTVMRLHREKIIWSDSDRSETHCHAAESILKLNHTSMQDWVDVYRRKTYY